MRSHTGTSLSLGYTGALTDLSTGFVDLRARELDPALGRFLSADTVQPNAPGSQGYNRYAYVANNPTTWVDPSGRDVESVLTAVGVSAEILAVLASPELIGLVAVGVLVVVTLWAVIAILNCVLDSRCMDRLREQGNAIKQYGSAAAAGAWTGGAQATRTAWHNFPQLPQQAFCAIGAAESMAVTSVQNAVGGSRGPASDYSMAAAWGCATSGSGGGGGNGPKPIDKWTKVIEDEVGSANINQSQPNVWEIRNSDLAQAKQIFTELTRDGTPIASNYPGQLYKLSDGTIIGLRETSKSIWPTIDINPLGEGVSYEFKFRP